MASRKLSSKTKSAKIKKYGAKVAPKKSGIKETKLPIPVTKKAGSKAAKKGNKKALKNKITVTVKRQPSHHGLSDKPIAKPISRLSKPPIIKQGETDSQQVNLIPTEPVATLTGQNINHIDDPIRAIDQKAFDKITAKGDPHQRIQPSSRRKGTIRPVGKKPLWN